MRLKPAETLAFAFMGIMAAAAFLWLFYGTVMVLIPAAFAGFPAVCLARTFKQKSRVKQLKNRFMDALGCLGSSLEAGESPEGAVISCLKDLALLYPPEDVIITEFQAIVRQLHTNRSLEEALSDFATRTGDEDIVRFAEIFAISKRSGGKLLDIIKSTEHTMAGRQAVLREIDTVTAAKRLEAGIMALMPAGIILYFKIADKDFLEPLYSGTGGRLVMTAVLMAYLGFLYMIKKITDIGV